MTHIASFGFVSTPEKFIYFHFTLFEMNFRDFCKILVPEVTGNLSPRKSKNIPIVSEFNESFLGH